MGTKCDRRSPVRERLGPVPARSYCPGLRARARSTVLSNRPTAAAAARLTPPSAKATGGGCSVLRSIAPLGIESAGGKTEYYSKILAGKELRPMFDWKVRSQFLKTMPRRSMVLLLLGVACLFSAIGSIADAMNMEHSTPFSFVFSVVVYGVGAVLWAFFFTVGMWKSLIGMFLYQSLIFPHLMAWAGSKQPRILNTTQLRQEWVRHGGVTLACIIAGYVLFIVFFRREGERYFAAHTEIQLASAIQAELVPAISTRSGAFEFYGVSVPSGNVGGDLLDVVTNGNSFCAYVADIAGHGVPAGVVMSMVKSAVRMRMASLGPCDDGLLRALNDVVYPLTASNAYATFVYLSGDGGHHLKF